MWFWIQLTLALLQPEISISSVLNWFKIVKRYSQYYQKNLHSVIVWKVSPFQRKALGLHHDGVNPSKTKWFRGNVSSNFISGISKLSILLPITSFSIWNLFRDKLIFKRAIMIRFEFFVESIIIEASHRLSIVFYLPTVFIESYVGMNFFTGTDICPTIYWRGTLA